MEARKATQVKLIIEVEGAKRPQDVAVALANAITGINAKIILVTECDGRTMLTNVMMIHREQGGGIAAVKSAQPDNSVPFTLEELLCEDA